MAHTVLKHYDTWAKHAVGFCLQVATFGKMTDNVFEIIESSLYVHYVRSVMMADQRESRNIFAKFPYSLNATDATFQPAYRLAGSFLE